MLKATQKKATQMVNFRIGEEDFKVSITFSEEEGHLIPSEETQKFFSFLKKKSVGLLPNDAEFTYPTEIRCFYEASKAHKLSWMIRKKASLLKLEVISGEFFSNKQREAETNMHLKRSKNIY